MDTFLELIGRLLRWAIFLGLAPLFVLSIVAMYFWWEKWEKSFHEDRRTFFLMLPVMGPAWVIMLVSEWWVELPFTG